MNAILRTTIAALTTLGVAFAANPKSTKRLTPTSIARLTAQTDAPAAKRFTVEVSAIGLTVLPAAKPQGEIEAIREFRYPTEFDPPQIGQVGGKPVMTPTTPTAFETIDTGWTIRVSARPLGKLVEVCGTADFVSVDLLDGGYGPLSGPIYEENGEGLISPNVLKQPRTQTTSTRFHIFALPGEPCEVTLYRGTKGEKHAVTVTGK